MRISDWSSDVCSSDLGVNVLKSSPDLMMVIHMLSPDDSRDQLYISNYARTQVVDRLARIDGVGRATVFAERAYSMRIWPDRSEERRVGIEWVRTCRSRGSPYT